MTTKTCSYCHEELDLEEFYRRFADRDLTLENSQGYCMSCEAIYAGRTPNHAGDGRAYAPIGRIERDETYESRDAVRRAALVKRSA